MTTESVTRCGHVALVGRPNVGKSTLLNRILGQKVTITAPKPQTTRHNILGISTIGDTQIVYVDTPGMHLHGKRALNRYLNRTARSALGFVDLAVFIVDALRWTEEDEAILRRLREFEGQVILAVNKIDRIPNRAQLLPYLQRLGDEFDYGEIIPISAKDGTNVAELQRALASRLPVSPFFYSPDQITNVSERFLAAELIREKLTRRLHEELPYSLSVEIERFVDDESLVRIDAVIWVERSGQKAIVIGKGGEVLREVGRMARTDLERILERKVFLKTWVKLREGWANNETALRGLGYREDV